MHESDSTGDPAPRERSARSIRNITEPTTDRLGVCGLLARVSEATWRRHREGRAVAQDDRDRFLARYPNGKTFLFWREEAGYFGRRLDPAEIATGADLLRASCPPLPGCDL
jgi:hypothetical protein